MFKRVLTVGLYSLMCFGLSAMSSMGATIEVNSAGASRTIDCRGQRVVVNGTGNNVMLLGECPSVEINGMNQKVKIEIAGSIEVNGMGNKVIWSEALRGSRPNVENNGMNNSVRQGAVGSGGKASSSRKTGGKQDVTITSGGETVGISASTDEDDEAATTISSGGESVDISVKERKGRKKVNIGGVAIETGGGSASISSVGEQIVIDDNDLTKTIECDGDDVKVDGNDNTLRLRGECGKVFVNGNRNMMKIEAVVSISALGNENDITWERGVGRNAPKISDLGNDNSIRKSER
jgi:hypothetical protein